jgi:hypothetical protein
MSISYVQNGDSGLVARTIINQVIDEVNNGPFPYTGSAIISGSLEVTGELIIPIIQPNNPNTGSMYVDFSVSTSSPCLFLYNGTSWVSSSIF